MLRSQVYFFCFMHSVTDHSTTRWTKSGPKTRLARQARGAILEEADSLLMVPDRGWPRYWSPSGRGSQADTLVWDRQEYVGGAGGKFSGRNAFFPSLFHMLKSHVYPSFWLKFLEQPLSLKKRERVIMERDGNWFRWIILVLGLCVWFIFSLPLFQAFPCFLAELKDILSMHATKHKNFQATHPNLIILG